MEKLYIIIPAYNEEDNIENTIREWYPIIKKYNGNGLSRLVVVNDGSTDHTWKILCQLEKQFPLFKKNHRKYGLPAASSYLWCEDSRCKCSFPSDENFPYKKIHQKTSTGL